MAKEDHTEDADLSQENGGDQSQEQSQDQSQDNNGQQQDQGDESQSDQQQEGSQEDYRGKLNATNRFLEKEGYEFKDGRWQKEPQSSAQESDSQQQQQNQTESKPALSRDEAILIAQGKSVAEVEHAQRVAQVLNKPLLEAVNDPLYTTWETQTRKEAKDRAALLGTGKGGRSSQKKTFQSKGLSDDEHRQMFQEKFGG